MKSSRTVRRTAVRAAFAVSAAAALVTATTGAAHAAPVRLNYPLTGSTVLKGTGSTVNLGPGTLEASADLFAGTLTANTKLPPAKVSFNMLGVIPVSATTEFIETEPTTGTLDLKTGETKTTTKLTLRLKDMKVAGIPTPVGDHCETRTPAVLNLSSEAGFNPLRGGNLSGTYTIPAFEHCLLSTPLINLIVPGDGNTIKLTLGAATQPPTTS
ncbi:hypothetical protein HUT18_32945 [Streptomyces sp. NA04227]|uniref:hypothetical protein n=1 Tax=Streptomyces sp. NA04227 TaxID=2742136 RepID=UPI00158FB50A|nr:hypothetical protein [Streptomyces sp. NA04227]QKW10515.1 hypothetical protein HUT18_32945 [Streptomyces sp. NA04227]